MVKGGKAIASGGYGCVFYPALKCKTKKKRSSGVSKLLTKKAAQDEFNEAKEIRSVMDKIPGIEKYILLPESMCKPDELTTEDLEDYNVTCKKHIGARQGLNRYTILNMPLGGVDISEYISKNTFGQKRLLAGTNASTFITVNNKIIELLLNAVSKLNEEKLLHADLKAENILIDNDLNCRIIDWGLSFSTQDKPSDHFFTEMEWRPIQFNIPCSTILFSNFYMMEINGMLDEMDFNGKGISPSKIEGYLKKEFPNYLEEYGRGHYDYVTDNFKILIDNLSLNLKPKDMIFKYISNCVYKFIRHNRELSFDINGYINEVFIYNCDIWGLLSCYFDFLKSTYDNSVQAIAFRKQLSSVLYKYMIDCDDSRINIQELAHDLNELNKFMIMEPRRPTPGDLTKSIQKSTYKSPPKSTIQQIILPDDLTKSIQKSTYKSPSKSTIQQIILPDDLTKSIQKSTYKSPPKTTIAPPSSKILATRLSSIKSHLLIHQPKTTDTEESFMKKYDKPKNVRNKRCPNGTRRHKKTGVCETLRRPGTLEQRKHNLSKLSTMRRSDKVKYLNSLSNNIIETRKRKPRCPNGTRRNKNGDCVKKI